MAERQTRRSQKPLSSDVWVQIPPRAPIQTIPLGDLMNLIQHIYSNIVLITGHYGCGKTNLCANMAIELAKAGVEVSIVDLDIVNPYFRISDYTLELEQLGIKMIAPNFAGTTLDTPSLGPQIQTVLERAACAGADSAFVHGDELQGGLQGSVLNAGTQNIDSVVLVDVGGDPDGATALGRYKKIILQANYQMFYVVNQRRFQTSTAEEALELMHQIEQISGLSATHIVGNTHLMEHTTADIIVESCEYSKDVASAAGLPLEFITAPSKLGAGMEQKINDKIPVFLVDKYVGFTLP